MRSPSPSSTTAADSGSASPHLIGHIRADRARAPVRKRHHQEHDTIDAPEVIRSQHLAEQRMPQRPHPHLARQHRTNLLQSVGITPGTGKTHLSIALAVQAARRGHRIAFATAHQWVQRLDTAQQAGRLDAELDRLRRIPLLVCDEVGYIPFEPEAAALFYALVANGYERASMIVSSNKPFSAGPRSSATPSPWPPWSTDSSTTPRSSTSKASPTDSKTDARNSPPNDQTVQNSAVAQRPDFDRR
jgi:hypothetical protein